MRNTDKRFLHSEQRTMDVSNLGNLVQVIELTSVVRWAPNNALFGGLITSQVKRISFFHNSGQSGVRLVE